MLVTPILHKQLHNFDIDGVLKILEKAVIILKETPVDGRIISLHDVIHKNGIEKFKI